MVRASRDDLEDLIRKFGSNFPNARVGILSVDRLGVFGKLAVLLGAYWTFVSLYESFAYNDSAIVFDSLHWCYLIQLTYYTIIITFQFAPKNVRLLFLAHHYTLVYLTPIVNTAVYLHYWSSTPSLACSFAKEHELTPKSNFLTYPVYTWIVFVMSYRNTLGLHTYYELVTQHELDAATVKTKLFPIAFKHTSSAYILFCPMVLLLLSWVSLSFTPSVNYAAKDLCGTLDGWQSNWPFSVNSSDKSFSVGWYAFLSLLLQNAYFICYAFNTFQYQFLYLETFDDGNIFAKGAVVGGFLTNVAMWVLK